MIDKSENNHRLSGCNIEEEENNLLSEQDVKGIEIISSQSGKIFCNKWRSIKIYCIKLFAILMLK